MGQCLLENELFGLDNECVLDLVVGDEVYWMVGMVVLLTSSASFVLSCSNQRMGDYKRMRMKARESTRVTVGKVLSRTKSSKGSKGSKGSKEGQSGHSGVNSNDVSVNSNIAS